MKDDIRQFATKGFDPLALDMGERDKSLELDRLKRVETANSDFLWLVGDKRGRRILWGIFSEAKLFESAFLNLGKDERNADLKLAYIEGTRTNAYKMFRKLQELAPDAFQKMIQEQKEIANGRT